MAVNGPNYTGNVGFSSENAFCGSRDLPGCVCIFFHEPEKMPVDAKNL